MPKIGHWKHTYGENNEHTHEQYHLHCPGCNKFHAIGTDPAHHHKFNGDFERPTFSPSILCNGSRFTALGEQQYAEWMKDTSKKAPEQFDTEPWVCHSYVENGVWRFLDDCSHELRGKTVPVPDFVPDPRAEHYVNFQ